ncbi:MAG: hypothetical protein VW339_11330 [Quisquiliibacterium sp.]
MIENAPKIRIAPSFRRPTPAQIAGLRDVPTGFVVDALGGGNTMDYRVKPVIAEQGILYGVAITCDAGPADNLAVFASLKHLEPGDVIVAASAGHTGCAVAGDLLLGMARNCGAAGFVTDGCVRDIPGIRGVGLPCFAIGVTPNTPAKEGPGTVGFPIVCAGAAVSTGDIIVGDQDGVVIVPFERIDEAIARLVKVRAAEAELDAKVKAGLRLPPFMQP